MKKNIFFILIFTVALFSCAKQKDDFTIPEDTLLLEIIPSEETPYTELPKWHFTNKKVCILFGYDFNSPEIVESYRQILAENFGLEEEGGLIYTLTYPDDFKHGGRTYVTDLKNYLSDTSKDFCGIIILGAPEKTHISLARLQDDWSMNIPFPIVALFPQDDVLGLESTCDIVIDHMQSGEIADEEFTNEDDFIKERAPKILCRTIEYICDLGSSLKKDAAIQQNVMQMYSNQKIAHYLDPETGLQSINHFILY